MEHLNIGKHISGQFNAELEAIRNNVMAMGGLVEQQLTDALDALQRSDSAEAAKIIERDRRVNSMEVNIDEECTRIIAKRQPTASDLRLVLAISKAVTELERIGDSAERIARLAQQQDPAGFRNMLSALDSMGRHAQRMLHDVLDAFARMDVDAAMRIHEEDVKLDQAYEGVVRQLMTFMMEDPRSIPNVLDVLWAVRALERVGDRCKNICEQIIYYVKGKDVRHLERSQVQDLLK
ncbi:phosphate signaling complex protein PhoU [Ferrimonas lipolytica]|uniref:Phosphate-specific transport system accessory protein PhoU n=1 Tax=Ferrimonas lipolytica TaxID=2724191 RepID=A0A6H1UFN5_9GAMM|nr:phosphate signaling complex protein PhoU [Ferrimonas lipolytica]QIZ77026.1 phosphate signaling complex protein PhoU [Ferrimonas lipolytica]